ncbi:MAG: hypothetical protein ACPGLV_06195 [Bacteroidia bacterium]
MKSFLLTSLLLVFTDLAVAQQIMANSGFEENDYANTSNDPCSFAEPFFTSKVDYWKSSHGSAQLIDPSITGCGIQSNSGGYHAFMTGGGNIEGIFQEGLNLKMGDVVTITMYALGNLKVSF